MKHAIRVVLLAGAFAAATGAVGWWGVPVVATCWGVLARADRASALEAGLAASLAWGAWLAVESARGPIGAVAAIVAGDLGVRPVSVYVLTMAYPGLLALTAALVARSLARGRAAIR
ncbi:MAG TPA: hypothetical protein VJL28_15485 [Gemmatimonadaceae bacterium]|nr:hypothetical protein [Gemmatimonadaceae bacterium]